MPMRVSDKAVTRLRRLLDSAGQEACGFRFRGHVGTCRGSTPVIRPASGPEDGETAVDCGGIVFYVPEEYRVLFDLGALDYESGLFGKGLYLTWEHGSGVPCACQE